MKFYVPAQDVKDMFYPSQKMRMTSELTTNVLFFPLFLKKMFLKGEAFAYYELQYKILIIHKDMQLSIVKYFIEILMLKTCLRAEIFITW